jgi:phosphatidylglycerophosphatase C
MPGPQRQGSPHRVVVFDLDGTLVRGDSFALFLRVLMLRRPPRAAASLLAAVILLPLLLLPVTRNRAVSGFLWLATVGLSPDCFDALAQEFALAHAAEARRIAVALDRLHSHLQAGDRVIVATGCADPLASAVCKALGLTDVEVIATRLGHSRRAQRVLEGCRGTGKLRRLQQAGIVTPVSFAYTDSAVDLPLLRAAACPVLVDPSPRAQRQVREALGGDPEILRA